MYPPPPPRPPAPDKLVHLLKSSPQRSTSVLTAEKGTPFWFATPLTHPNCSMFMLSFINNTYTLQSVFVANEGNKYRFKERQDISNSSNIYIVNPNLWSGCTVHPPTPPRPAPTNNQTTVNVTTIRNNPQSLKSLQRPLWHLPSDTHLFLPELPQRLATYREMCPGLGILP